MLVVSDCGGHGQHDREVTGWAGLFRAGSRGLSTNCCPYRLEIPRHIDASDSKKIKNWLQQLSLPVILCGHARRVRVVPVSVVDPPLAVHLLLALTDGTYTSTVSWEMLR